MSAASVPAPWPPRVIALGADHGGVVLKDEIARYLTAKGFSIVDCGTRGRASVDYPDYAAAAARAVQRGEAGAGIVADTWGIGSAIAANKISGIRAVLVGDVDAAVSSRAHNDANVLSLGARTISMAQAFRIASVWLATPFEGGRHLARVQKIRDLES